MTDSTDERIARKQARFNELKDDLKLKILHTEIAKIYIGLKHKTRDSQEMSIATNKSGAVNRRLTSANEREIIM